MTNRKTNLEIACEYAVKMDFEVFPVHYINLEGLCSCKDPKCSSPGKHPLTKNGFKNASKEPEVIGEMFHEHPNANIGIATGKSSNIEVIDIDPQNGGDESWKLISEQVEIPSTLVSQTGGGGKHMFFRYSGRKPSKKLLRKGVDFQSGGQYIIVPPSRHKSGNCYKWVEEGVPIVDLPEDLFNALLIEENHKSQSSIIGSQNNHVIKEGSRNNSLTIYAGQLRAQGLRQAEILVLLRDKNSQCCKPPLEDKEVVQISESMGRYEPGKIDPNVLAEQYLEEHMIITSKKNGYEYREGVWHVLSDEEILHELWKLAPNSKREKRKEALDYVQTKTFKKQIPWRNMPETYIPFKNNILNLRTGKKLEHKPEYYLEGTLLHDFVPSISCPIWESCLETYFDNLEDRLTLQEFFGYILLPKNRYKKALLGWGESDTGKSIVAQVGLRMVGVSNHCSLDISSLRKEETKAAIKGKMLNLITELGENSKLDEKGFKELISEEPTQIRELYKQAESYEPSTKHAIFTNKLPKIKDSSRGVWNRLLLLEFKNVIPKDKQDKYLIDKLADEMEGIIVWAVEGAKRLLVNGKFTESKDSRNNLKRYELRENIAHEWAQDRLKKAIGGRVAFKQMFEDFLCWHKIRFQVPSDMNKETFAKLLSKAGFKTKTLRFNGDVTDKGLQDYALGS